MGKPFNYKYWTFRAPDHGAVEKKCNELAADCWEPVHYAIWPQGSQGGTAEHFVIFRQDWKELQEHLDHLQEGWEQGRWSNEPDHGNYARDLLRKHKRIS